MNIKLCRKPSGFTLCGVIVGIILLAVGTAAVILLKRLSEIKPRELPPETQDALDNHHPGWYTNYTMVPSYMVPWCLDLVTPELQEPVYVKEILADAFYVQVCKDQSLTEWEDVYLWIVGDMNTFMPTPADVDIVYGSQSYTKDGVTYKMGKDFAIDIDVHPSVKATNRCMFWKTVEY